MPLQTLLTTAILQINERKVTRPLSEHLFLQPVPYRIKTLNGELAPWRLRPRGIPMPEETSFTMNTIRACHGPICIEDWTAFFSEGKSITLPGSSSHSLDLQADVHSTAFLRWSFRAAQNSQVKLKVTYSEGYELEPRSYPFFRTKLDRLDVTNGHLIGPYDEVDLDLPKGHTVTYEPFWFRTFRLMRVEIKAGPTSVEMLPFEAKQVNYPLDVKASWKEPGDPDSDNIWEVSIRTLRNCMFDAYSDCPFYEQLQ